MLHLLSRSRFSDPALYRRAINALDENDALVFIGDGVLGLAGLSKEELPPLQVPLYFVQEDMASRGGAGELPEGIQGIDMARLVELSAEHPRSISWY